MPESKFSLCLTALDESGVYSGRRFGCGVRCHLNLITRYGPLDLLATIGDGLTYDDLLPHSELMSITGSTRSRLLGLDRIIAIKEALGGEKDIAVLPVLRQTAREVKRRQSSKPR